MKLDEPMDVYHGGTEFPRGVLGGGVDIVRPGLFAIA